MQAAQAGRASRQLFEQASTLERIVRQHLILEDNALLDDYARVRQEFRQTARQLALLPLEPPQLAALEALTDSESRLHKLLATPQRTPKCRRSSPTAMPGSPTARRRRSPRQPADRARDRPAARKRRRRAARNGSTWRSPPSASRWRWRSSSPC